MNRRIVRACLLVVIGCLLTTFTSLHAQGGADDTKHTFAPINTAIPALSIAPDARGGGACAELAWLQLFDGTHLPGAVCDGAVCLLDGGA